MVWSQPSVVWTDCLLLSVDTRYAKVAVCDASPQSTVAQEICWRWTNVLALMLAVLWSAVFVPRWRRSDPLGVPPHYICHVVSAAAGKVSSACFLFSDTRFAFLLFHVALMVDKRGRSKVQFDTSSSFFSPHNQTPLFSSFHYISSVMSYGSPLSLS